MFLLTGKLGDDLYEVTDILSRKLHRVTGGGLKSRVLSGKKIYGVSEQGKVIKIFKSLKEYVDHYSARVLLSGITGEPITVDCDEFEIILEANGSKSTYIIKLVKEIEFEELVIPDFITYVAEGFHLCKGLKRVVLPDSCLGISEYAFSDCKTLARVEGGKNVSAISGRAFFKTSELTQFPDFPSLTYLGYECFAYSGICAFNAASNLGTISSGAFMYSDIDFLDLSNAENISMEARCFAGCEALKTIKLPRRIYEFDDSCFYNCTNLKDIYYKTGSLFDMDEDFRAMFKDNPTVRMCRVI